MRTTVLYAGAATMIVLAIPFYDMPAQGAVGLGLMWIGLAVSANN